MRITWMNIRRWKNLDSEYVARTISCATARIIYEASGSLLKFSLGYQQCHSYAGIEEP